MIQISESSTVKLELELSKMQAHCLVGFLERCFTLTHNENSDLTMDRNEFMLLGDMYTKLDEYLRFGVEE